MIFPKTVESINLTPRISDSGIEPKDPTSDSVRPLIFFFRNEDEKFSQRPLVGALKAKAHGFSRRGYPNLADCHLHDAHL